ncbi:MAG: cupin domain-containing protein [Rubrivivax sp.]
MTDIFQQAGLRRRVLGPHRVAAGVALRFPCSKSMGLHVVTQGPLHLHAPDLPQPLRLVRGDIAFMARGCDHALAVPDTLHDLALATIGTAADGVPQPQPGDAAAMSGAYQLWNEPLHPFLQALPGWFVLRADDVQPLGPLGLVLGLLTAEAGRDEPGSATVLNGLFDVVFTYVLRELMARHQGAGWGPAVRDAAVHRALACLHAELDHPWTLDSLAAACGLSRTGLAERFRTAVGDTPLAYLRTLRMQKAMQLLSETTQPLDVVAQAVGYQDAFSFSKVFKREAGVSPRDFRRQDAADRMLPWRFRSA